MITISDPKMNPKFYFAPKISVWLPSIALVICALTLLGPTGTMGHENRGQSIGSHSRNDQLFRGFLNQTTSKTAPASARPEDDFIILVEQSLQHYYDVLEIGYLNRDHLVDEICQNQWLLDENYGDDDDADADADDDEEVVTMCAVSFLLESRDRLEQMIQDTFQMVQPDVHDCPDEDRLRERCCELVRLIKRKRLCPDLRQICHEFILDKFPKRYQNKFVTILRTSGVKQLQIRADYVCHSSIHHPFATLLWLELTDYLDECYRPPWPTGRHGRTASTCPNRSVGLHEREIIEKIMFQLFHQIEHILFKH